jgi:alkylation response protein AidB-like acyl-CoA dehydrogenase
MRSLNRRDPLLELARGQRAASEGVDEAVFLFGELGVLGAQCPVEFAGGGLLVGERGFERGRELLAVVEVELECAVVVGDAFLDLLRG